MHIFQSVAVAIAVIAAVCDLKTRRIPNVLTFGAALAGLVVHASLGGWSGVGLSLGGWVVGVATLFPFFALGGMGAGDVKLLGAVGAWLGPMAAVWVALLSSLAGGLMALVVALRARYLSRALTNVWALLMYWRIAGPRPSPDLVLSNHAGPRLAYAVPVLAGVVLTLWLQ